MILEVEKLADVPAPLSTTWALVSNVPRLTRCLPNVIDLEAADENGHYSATLSDKLGPFRLTIPVKIKLQDVDNLRRIEAFVSGNDRNGQARIKGTLEAGLNPAADGTQLLIRMRMDVLGRLAALGAAPMRRRADQIFSEFLNCVRAELRMKTSEPGPEESSRG